MMEYMKSYREWLESPFIDEDIKTELRSISNNEKEIQDRFYKDLEFGTGGMRGIIGAGTNRMNKHIIGRVTQGLAAFIKKSKETNSSCVIAHDSRRMSIEFSRIAAAVLAANGIKAYLFESLRSTPQLSYTVRQLGCTAGIVITASHNPPEYNGYKVYWKDGCQMLPDMASDLVRSVEGISFDNIQRISFDQGITSGKIVILGSEMDDLFIEAVKSLSLRDSEIDKSIRIVYTPLHGTGNIPVRRVLQERGFDYVYPVMEQVTPDGEFPTVEYPNPEDEKAFEYAYREGRIKDADIIVANDPDCDRVGLAVKDGHQYRLLSGNQVGPLLLEYILSSMVEKDLMPTNPLVIKTIVTSEFGRAVANYYNVDCIDTLTGFKFIGEKMEEYAENKNKNFIFGYEESIGYLFGNFVRDKDAVTSTMMICEMAAYYKKIGSNILSELEKLYQRHGYYMDGLKSITMTGITGNQKILAIMDYFRNAKISQISGYKVSCFTDYEAGYTYDLENEQKIKTGLPQSNVLKYVFENKSWFVLRPSGTEPKIKIYFSTVHQDKHKAEKMYQDIATSVLQIIDSV